MHPGGEPRGLSNRPEEEMTTPNRSHPDHETHDPLLVAALAAGDIESRDLTRAELQVAGCPDCTGLRNELVAIAAATTRLPAPARSREFTLSQDDAARLRRPSLRRLLIDLAGPRGLIGRPIATAVTSLGVAGIVLASAGTLGSLGAAGAASAPAPGVGSHAPSENRASGSAAPEHVTGVQGGASLGPAASQPPQDTSSGVDGLESGAPGSQGQAAAPTPAPNPDDQGIKATADRDTGSNLSPLVPISIGLVVLGLGLFALRRVAARLA